MTSAVLLPQAEIPWAKPSFWGEEKNYVNEALTSTWISGGPFVERFEKEFGTHCGTPNTLTSSNGTTAIHMAYIGLNLNPGDEIIVPGFGFLCAANVAVNMSLRPVFCEVDPETWCMRREHVEAVVTERTRAVVAVHTYGGVCDMAPLLDLGREKGISIIEDAAEAFPSKYDGKLAGTLGDIGTFSFQATKTITTGEGGMVVTSNSSLAKRMALFRSHGLLRRRHYWHEVPGMNFRLTNLQAALGCAQLEQLDRIVTEKNRVTMLYRDALATVPGISLQAFEKNVDPVVWAIALRLDDNRYPQGRDTVMQQMGELGIETRPGFYAASEFDFYGDQSLLITCEQLSRSIISLPSYPTITADEIGRVCNTLRKISLASS